MSDRPRLPLPTPVSDYSSNKPGEGQSTWPYMLIVFLIVVAAACMIGAFIYDEATAAPPRVCEQVEYQYKERIHKGGPLILVPVCKRWAQ